MVVVVVVVVGGVVGGVAVNGAVRMVVVRPSLESRRLEICLRGGILSRNSRLALRIGEDEDEGGAEYVLLFLSSATPEPIPGLEPIPEPVPESEPAVV